MISAETLISIFVDDDAEQLTNLISNVNDHTFPKTNNKYKYTKILSCSQGAPLISIAAYFGAQNCYQYLADTETEVPDFKISVMEYACAGGNMNIIRDVSVKFPNNIIAKNYFYYYSAGYLAIYYGNFDAVKWLLLKGYKFTKNEISNAFLLGYEDIADFFIENNELNREISDFYNWAIELLCLSGNDKFLQKLLTKFSHKKFTKNHYQQFINKACQEGNLSCVKCLINNSKNFFPRSYSIFIQPSLLSASKFEYLDIIIYLVRKGGTLYDIKSYISPLKIALTSGSIDTAEYYLNNMPKIETDTIIEFFINVFFSFYSYPIMELLLKYINKTLFEMKEMFTELSIKYSVLDFFDDLVDNQISLDFITIDYFDKYAYQYEVFYKLYSLGQKYKFDIHNKVFLAALKSVNDRFLDFAFSAGAVLTDEVVEASECIKYRSNFFKKENLIEKVLRSKIDLSKYPNFLNDLINSCGRKVFIYEQLAVDAIDNGACITREDIIYALNKKWSLMFRKAIDIKYYPIEVDEIPLDNLVYNHFYYEDILKLIIERQPSIYDQLIEKINRLNIDNTATTIIKSLQPVKPQPVIRIMIFKK